MILEIGNHSYHQQIQDLDLILYNEECELFKYPNGLTTARARRLF